MLRSKIKPTGGEAPRDHGTQIRANGSSQNDSNRLPVKFQVNRTSDDRTSKLGELPHCEIKSSIDGTPNGFKTQIKAHGWSYLMPKKLHLKFQVIPTSFDPVSTLDGKSATESSAFPKNRKLCALICTGFQQVFFREIKPINEEKCQRKIQEKTEAKKPEKRPRNGDRKMDQSPRSPATLAHGCRRPWPKVASPMVTGDHGCMVAGDPGNPGCRISAKSAVFPFFFAFRDVWPL
ncbi:hypothetical protein AAC387_Pa04g2857 [Persea americana]